MLCLGVETVADTDTKQIDNTEDTQPEELLETLAELSQLPREVVEEELTRLMSRVGVSPERSMSLDELRQALILELEQLNEAILSGEVESGLPLEQ